MVKLHWDKTYVLKNAHIASPNEMAGMEEEEALKGTITYRILRAHNRSTDRKNLDIYFASMGICDNTYVGILQTAKACGLKKFPIPCVFTNCHNCLNAVGGTLNADVHKYGLSASIKYGGIYVPPHLAVIHQYMREMIINSGDMAIVSDSHTRYGPLGSLSIGEGGPELVKVMLHKGYALKYPKVIGVFVTGKLKPWVGPMDVALTLIGSVFKNRFAKDAVLEFIGPGISSLSMDTRNGIDTMTTETTCLSSIWLTDEKTKDYYEIHNRGEGYREIVPGPIALYDGLIELDLSQIEPMIALPFHPSNVYPLSEVIENPDDAMAQIDADAREIFKGYKNITYNMQSKVKDGRIHVDQGIVAGCSSGSFENIYVINQLAKKLGRGVGTFNFNIYPASQPIMYELNRIGVLNTLMGYGVRIKSAFCGPCFGASDIPGNNDLSIRHTTRNFPNREGSNPANGQFAGVALMDSRSIAAAAFNGGVLVNPENYWCDFALPQYRFNGEIYRNTVYNGFSRAKPEVELTYGPDIKDWPEMTTLAENLFLQVASVIRDEVTTTDELIPSGEISSYRSNPYKISQFTLIRRDPQYVRNATRIREYEEARLMGDVEKAAQYFGVLYAAGIDIPLQILMDTTGIGSVLYARRPGDGSAREYAASCQKVLGGIANISVEYATKRYRSNCINWGILPFTNPDKQIQLAVGEHIYVPGIRRAIAEGSSAVEAMIIGKDGGIRSLRLGLEGLSEEDRRILLAGGLINYYRG